LVVPLAVQLDVEGEGAKAALKALNGTTFLTEAPAGADELGRRYPQLGPGEISVLAWVQEQPKGTAVACVLDDGLARRVADRLGLLYTGLVGLLERLVEHGRLTTAEQSGILAQLQVKGFRYKAP
jgi:predicted nucleic acid-binding protein